MLVCVIYQHFDVERCWRMETGLVVGEMLKGSSGKKRNKAVFLMR